MSKTLNISLHNIKKALKDKISGKFKMPTVYILYGSQGTGKTKLKKNNY